MEHIYSKLKATLNLKENVDVQKYEKLKNDLKNKNKGFVPKKAYTFSLEHLNKFIELAQDDIDLATKVCIFFI